MDSIIDVPGIDVGHVENREAPTGCTVILTPQGAVAGVDVRGSAPGTRETDLLDPINLVNEVHAVVLSGGSAFGLAAADGVMRYLEEQNIGLDVGVAKVPIVPQAVLFDLAVGDPSVRPTAEMGYEAARRASKEPFPYGNVGAGCGATVGKLLGPKQAMKGGLGSASITLPGGIVVGAIVAVNAVGEVRDVDGTILASARHPETNERIDSIAYLKEHPHIEALPGGNTTIGVVAANVKMTKAEAQKIAQIAQNGIARSIYPAHTMLDGDTIFALGTGEHKVPIDVVGNLAAEAMQVAIARAIRFAESSHGIPSYAEVTNE